MNILSIIFAVFAIIGALDRITGNHFKLGEEFEKGITASGTLALAMVGMICIAPTLANLISPVLEPFSALTHIDKSFLGSFIANDMGGASIASVLASDEVVGGFNGLVVASMMGCTICFTVPVALKTIDSKYHKEVLSGILCGIATMPIGCIVSGIMLGISFGSLMLNLIPVILMAAITCIGLVFKPDLCRKIFGIIGKIVIIIITVGLAAGIFEYITGYTLIPGMAPVEEGFAIVAGIAIILAGVFPLIAFISKICKKPFMKIGSKIGIDENSVLGLISSLANSIPTFDLAEKMNEKGRMMNMAFTVSASFVFGDHLAFTMAYDKAYLPAMIAGKLVGGIAAVVAAHFMYKKSVKQ
ncbi:MAG: ethanolamine utilization protein EutH [Clostridia bacterium]|nr:ethanolamine utilization protein EutH [Clostridia bacterium]